MMNITLNNYKLESKAGYSRYTLTSENEVICFDCSPVDGEIKLYIVNVEKNGRVYYSSRYNNKYMPLIREAAVLLAKGGYLWDFGMNCSYIDAYSKKLEKMYYDSLNYFIKCKENDMTILGNSKEVPTLEQYKKYMLNGYKTN